METNTSNSGNFDENQSFQVIQEMIQVSQKKLKNNGILFILWGWLMFYQYASSYLTKISLIYQVKTTIRFIWYLFALFVVAYTIYTLVKQRKKVQTYISISLIYIWVSVVVCSSLINMILFNVLHKANFTLQHPVFMVLIAFAITISGGILRYRPLILGGIIFGILAYVSSYFKLHDQLLFEAIAWLFAFIIPGHILYYKRNK